MISILLHSSKSMLPTEPPQPSRAPQLIAKTERLAAYLRTLSEAQLVKHMHVSPALAAKTHQLIAGWGTAPDKQSLALDAFIGDIYSGLRPQELSPSERDYADQTLYILSGLYGSIRPYDAICPYRLEMGYTFPDEPFKNLYGFWGTDIAGCLPKNGYIVNVSSVEYTKTILPYVAADRVITPEFLTVDPKTGQPAFRTVHAKIARGAFARWLIVSREQDPAAFQNFSDIGYRYDKSRSTLHSPVFVCETFGGKGLSIKMQAKARQAT